MTDLVAQTQAPAPLPPAWLQLDDADLAEALQEAKELYVQELARVLQPIARDIAEMTAELTARLEERKAKALAHPELTIEITRDYKYDKRLSVLLELNELADKPGGVPEKELRAALCIVPPPTEAVWSAHAGKLNALAEKYGGKVREIIERGLVKDWGKPQLVIARREPDKKVAPTMQTSAEFVDQRPSNSLEAAS